MKELTQARLKERVKYLPHTGKFINLQKRRGPKGQVGCELGCYKQGYLNIAIDGYTYKAHRLAVLYMTGSFPTHGFVVDHLNGDGTDNRWKNIKVVTHQENMQNQKIRPDNTSGYRGVYFDKHRKVWYASIIEKGKQRRLGTFTTLEAAIKCRIREERRLGWKTHLDRDRDKTSVYKNTK